MICPVYIEIIGLAYGYPESLVETLRYSDSLPEQSVGRFLVHVETIFPQHMADALYRHAIAETHSHEEGYCGRLI